MGTITFLRSAKINRINKRKKPATIKNPRNVLFTNVPTHKARPINTNSRKKKASKKLMMPIAALAAALDALLVALAFTRSMYVFI